MGREPRNQLNMYVLPDMQQVRAAFDQLSQRKMLPALLDEFLGELPGPITLIDGHSYSVARESEDIRSHFPLVLKDVEEFMREYEVCSRS